MQTVGSWAGQVRAFLEDVSTVPARLVVTAVVLVSVYVVAYIALPRLAAALDSSADPRDGALGAPAAFFRQYVPAVLGRFLVRVAQAGFALGAVLSVLVVWEQWALLDYGRDVFRQSFPAISPLIVGRIVTSVVVLFLTYLGMSTLADAFEDFGSRTEWMTDHQEEVVLRMSQLSLFVLAGMVMLGLWGEDLSGLFVGAGFLGIVVGLAARQTLGSLIAGFVLMFSRPFTIGDWVKIGDQEGIVTDITIFNTRLENFDGEYVMLPNDRVSDRPIVNRSQKGLLRIRIDVGIDYEADPEHAREAAREAISGCKEVIDAPPPQVFPKSFGDSAVVLEMRFWIDHPTPPRKWKAVSAVVSTVKSTFEREGIKIPYPQRELSGRAETGGFRVRDETSVTSEAAPEPETD